MLFLKKVVAVVVVTVSTCCPYFSVANAKDIFVATNGNNSVSYENNSVNSPWRTVEKGLYSIKTGDTLYIRGGTYKQDRILTVHSEYVNKQMSGASIIMNAESGTKDKPVFIKNYNNENVVVDLKGVPLFLNLDNKSYWNFEGLVFKNAGVVFYVGADYKSTHSGFRNLEIYSSNANKNNGMIHFVTPHAEYAVVENNYFFGTSESRKAYDGDTSADAGKTTSCVYIRLLRHVKVLNNVCKNTHHGIFYKHRTYTVAEVENETKVYDPSPIDIEIAYNFIENSTRTSMSINANHAYIHDNIFGQSNDSVTNNSANGYPGGDYNRYEHNTFYTGGLNFTEETQSVDSFPGSNNNIVKNNLFLSGPQSIRIHWYNSSLPHNTTMDYNVYSHVEPIGANGITYSFSTWQSFYGQDEHSKSGIVQFVGGSSPSSIAGYALSPSSAGYKAASDGRDIGANVSLVGILTATPKSPPRAMIFH
ncbi:MAG: hypothetical protein KUG80_08000 [Gammaproteobacteria bacterium]|nr:hypothetical protein [Gammaproteobacteria bacterium]